ncbi:nonsense-mediated mRNA decay factor SMG7-like [Rutidosis leptorrhynchoides]|uniref:nonsense-mediated mRNA decay factor SMG7-like n=1 Tax=Rutidosis leptorrhynchoides TaxID=125765 RepID=UPI003A990365
MNGNQATPLRDQNEKQPSILEVVNTEKLLWATIQHKGISHVEVQDLYRKAQSIYEKIILNEYTTVDLQEIEYSLWKLHYKHIDEYRKKIKKVSTSTESTNNLNSHIEGFKLFLSEVAEFYKGLIAKFRKTCRLEETFVLKPSGIEPEIFQKCCYACHRFLVCLGDVSRYMELCKKPDAQKWAGAAMYYLEATTVWPHSGNPQNQLALLATYTGDEFLALYHCIRSLAVKEPFPDAHDNIRLLFEKNKTSLLQSLSTDAHIDFSKPLKRLSSQIKSHSMDSTNINKLRANENVDQAKVELWPLFVRMISFFLYKPSFEDLPHTFASTLKELELLLALNDVELGSSLEPYEAFDSSRKGPYRAIQAVAILIFVVQNFIKTPDPKGKNNEHLSACITWAWTCTFSFMGHLIQRCVTQNNQENCCSLLPAVLVFVEWYVGTLEYAETCEIDEKVSNAKSYFLAALVDLLTEFNSKERDMLDSSSQIALWEDHELRGFEPLSKSNDLLDFVTHSDYRRRFNEGNQIRISRIYRASIKIVDKLNDSSQSPILDDQSRKNFTPKKVDETSFVEEEEVILFKPLTRYNSEPIQTSSVDPVNNETSDEELRRSSSLVAEQNRAHGPPSLSGWVLNRESLNLENERGPKLAPISEIPTSSLANMSIAKESVYVDPIPSAPFLPEDPVWLRGNLVKEEQSIIGAPPVSRFMNLGAPQEPLGFSAAVPGLYRPPAFGLSSSEWLYRYNNNLSLEVPYSNHHLPVSGINSPGNVRGYDRFDVIDKWGNPLVMSPNPFEYQRPNVSGSSEIRTEQPQLLQHLKEREWKLLNESPFRGHPYMGN